MVIFLLQGAVPFSISLASTHPCPILILIEFEIKELHKDMIVCLGILSQNKMID